MHFGLVMECDYREGSTQEEAFLQAFEMADRAEEVTPSPAFAAFLESNLAAARRLFELVDAEPAVKPPAEPAALPAANDLRVEALTFRYAPDEPPALRQVSLELPEGKRLAVVGPSGAGKSTLIALLLRFWEYGEGRITLGGRDLRELLPDEVRSRLAVVRQKPFIFSGTLRENLLLAAAAMGLGACWMGVHPREDRIAHLKKLFNLPENMIPVAAIAVGHPAQQPPPRTRYNESKVHRHTLQS